MTRAAVLLLLLLAACAKPAATPAEALAAMRAALAAGDGSAYYELIDGESASSARAEVRERRALLERGDPPAEVLRGMPITADELRAGDVADAVKLFFPRRLHYFRDGDWYAAATQKAEGKDGDDAAWIDLAGADGHVRRLWFRIEGGRWRFDQTRSLAEIPR